MQIFFLLNAQDFVLLFVHIPIQPIKLVYINLCVREGVKETDITNTIARTNVNERFPLFFVFFLCHFVTTHPQSQFSTESIKKKINLCLFLEIILHNFELKKKSFNSGLFVFLPHILCESRTKCGWMRKRHINDVCIMFF